LAGKEALSIPGGRWRGCKAFLACAL